MAWGLTRWYYVMECVECLAIFQEEQEAAAKADKIKLALEKLKEAKVKKVNWNRFCMEKLN